MLFDGRDGVMDRHLRRHNTTCEEEVKERKEDRKGEERVWMVRGERRQKRIGDSSQCSI